jgi:transposase
MSSGRGLLLAYRQMCEASSAQTIRRVISGIVHLLKSSSRWQDCPPEYGPHTTIYTRYTRWARRGIWKNLFR